jgi:hypothetical protein
MFIECTTLLEGPGPSEKIVKIQTAEGTHEEVAVYKGLVKGNFLEVGPAIVKDRDTDRVLIELPTESASGRWRIWVSKSSIKETAEAA